jgi:hypothetical protein
MAKKQKETHAPSKTKKTTATRKSKALVPIGTQTLIPSRPLPSSPPISGLDAPANPLIVRGQVHMADESPLVGASVRAYDKDLRSEKRMGEPTITGPYGNFEIAYSAKQFQRGEKGSADLFIEVVAADGLSPVRSPVLFNAPPIAEVNLIIPAEVLQPPTLFEKIGRTLEPLLDGMKIVKLEEDAKRQDLSFLSGETGFEKNDLARFVMGRRLAAPKLQAEFWFALLGGSFFQFAENQSLSARLAAILDSLSSLDAAAVSKSLTRAFNQKEIREAFREKVAGWVEAFLNFVASRSVSGGADPTFVKLALDHARIERADKQEKFARLFNQHRALTPELLGALEKDPSFKKEEIADLQTSFRLAELSRGDFSVIKTLKEEFDVRHPEKIRSLAKKSESEWVELIKQKRAAGELRLPINIGEVTAQISFPEAEVYAKALERQFREAFPTTAFAGGLERALQNGGARGLRQAERLAKFLDVHQGFELLNTSVDDFLENNLVPEFREFKEDEDFKLELKAVQRVFKLAPTFEAADELMADEIHCAQQVYRLGETQFVQRYTGRAGFTAESARLAWNRAADTHAAALTIIGDLKALDGESIPIALKNGAGSLATFPNFNNLFKTGDFCECEQCRSALSPAAYFADLLMFLKDRYWNGVSVKDILFRRRADLGFLELSCDNAQTPLPYIDVVCEALEDVVAAGQNDIELPRFTAMPADPADAKRAVFVAFLKQNISLGADFSLSQVRPGDPDRWVAHGDDITYLLKKKASPNFFAEILRNTKASAAELRAYPQYVNPEAYKKLRAARFPFTLPFDLYAEEARAAFRKIDLQRWDLMRTLHGSVAPNNPTDGDIAAEYFGISADADATFDEKRLILVEDTTVAGQQAIWGETGNAAWLNTVGNVKTFLQKTGLEYNELLALLDLKFINPASDIAVRRPEDDSCDLDKKVIRVLDPTKLDRIHRFIRLWRKLKGWKMWELDLVIRHPRVGGGSLDEPFLINLFYFNELKNKLGGKTNVEQTLALFGDLNTETSFTKLYEKRADGLYQNLFLNKKVIQPIDIAFAVANVNVPGPTAEKIANHQPAALAGLGIREADLAILKGLTKASDGLPYITDDLTLTNLSFLWRHAWLSKLLKFKAEDWKALLKILRQDLLQFASPKAALDFVEWVDLLQATGFTPDELNWLLAADRSAKAAVKETDAARFLLALRKELQAIQTQYDPAQYDFLTVQTPTNVGQLSALLNTLLQKLNREESEASYFLATLRGSVLSESEAQGLEPAFTFPASITAAPNYIPIRHDAPRQVFRFTGLMTVDQRATLLDDASPALATLRGAGELTADAQGLPVGFDFPAEITGAPNNIPIQYDEPNTMFRFTGLMTVDQRAALLDEASPALATLRGAGELTADAQGLPVGFDFPAEITGAPNNIPIQYDEPNTLFRFTGLMTVDQRGILLNHLSLAAVAGNPDYQIAVEKLYQQSLTVMAAYRTAVEEIYQQSVNAITTYRNAIEDLYQQSLTATTIYASTKVKVSLPGGVTLPVDRPCIPISYNVATQTLSFTGVMTDDEKAALKAIPSNPAAAIDELFQFPRLAVKFYEPIFTAPLEVLPPAVDFKAQLPAGLAAKIAYDAEQRLLRFTGILSKDEQVALDALVRALPDEEAYHTAVNSLASQPLTIGAPDERIWLTSDDLDAAQAANDTMAKRLTNAAKKALSYLSKTFAANAVVEQSGAQLGLSESLTRRLMTYFAVLPDTLLAHLTGAFAATTGAVDYVSQKTTLDGWYWASRVAAIWKKWKITVEEIEILVAAGAAGGQSLTTAAKLLDFATLPLDASGTIASIDHFLRTSRLARLRDNLPETKTTLLEILRKLNDGQYTATATVTVNVQGLPPGFIFPAVITGAPNNIPIQYDEPNKTLRFTGEANTAHRTILLTDLSLAPVTGIATYRDAVEELFRSLMSDFASDVEGLNEACRAADVETIIPSLDLVFPFDYLLAESWERLRQAFFFLNRLNAGANTVKPFAATAMTATHAKTIKELLRSKFGPETWLTLSAEIQDDLRERKRDALAAFLLTLPTPADAPSGKWENTNDLYAYYLLDVEMGACQLTSRLAQASGSAQLFVQRCFMGLEPEVVVQADGANGDSAWRWWKWMRKYRVWEANRKVFLWPENWIEPELKKDRSPFFKDMENELLQNEVNQDTAETAISNYLEKLDGVAQLEIAGFCQEDDGDNTIVHVFARTPGAEPHLYYYRRYDYRQWTAWEKVELDIQGDYLIPAVVNRQLFLFWPVFTETPDEAGNSTVSIPAAGQTKFTPDKTKKRLRLQMAVSQYRQGKWTPKKVSKDFDESPPYDGEIVNKHYLFSPIDKSEVNGQFVIKYQGYSIDAIASRQASQSSMEAPWSSRKAGLYGEIDISGCKGAMEPTFLPWDFRYVYPAIRPEWESTGNEAVSLKWVERNVRHDQPENDFTLDNAYAGVPNSLRYTPVLMQTPEIFKMSPAWHFSYMDKLGLDSDSSYDTTGTWLPFFYNDKKRTFFALPSSDSPTISPSRGYYPEIKNILRGYESFFGGQVTTWVDGFVAMLTPEQRDELTYWLFLNQQVGLQPPYSDQQLKSLIAQFPLASVHFYLKSLSDDLLPSQQFHFKTFYHPFVCDFTKLVYNPLQGIPALMSRETQLKSSGFSFRQTYQPTSAVVEQPPAEAFYPKDMVDFTHDGAYSPYNWELFFHAPLLIANSLSKNQRFEEARDWYHFIFNPIGVESATPGGSPMSKYWITKPFYETTDPQYVQQRIENILRILAGDTSVPGFAETRAAIDQAVFDWRTNPFEPHRIANYRTVAYQKTVVMKYLDNLITWGDYLFRQDSMESINEATQLYILASEILGPRPKLIPPRAKPPVESFNELENQFDAFSNALVLVENLVPAQPGNKPGGANRPPLPMLYFCIPQNEKLLGYWDTVADRLYKIRHCMNIEGVTRQLALFEPPIDPGALVKAVAGGVDISAALADLNAPLPLYRFNVLLQKANEICNDVKALGGALLSALEKKDAEALGLLRQNQEIRLLEAVKAVREKQIEEAKENLAGVKKNKELVTLRRDYYQDIEKISAGESLHQDKLKAALDWQRVAQAISIAASVAHIVPSFDVGGAGAGGSPRAGVSFGGPNVGSALQAVAGGFTYQSNEENYAANKASIDAGHDRRWDDWKLQERLANKELEQIDESIAAAELRIAVAEKELDNHLLQIENAKAMDVFMRSKYTNQELYQWQMGQISGVYFQSYKQAYDLAKRAERCLRFELGLQDSSYINFGYWDSLKKGLLSGEKLQYDLRRLEAAYLEKNQREFELTKHISLALLDPLSLVRLRETGRCFFRLPEEIFDLDYPGHYFRRIKSVSITLPCVAGPYTTISCTLRMLKNSIRINAKSADNYPRKTEDGVPVDDDRFIENNIPVKSIAASNAQNDSGVFELSFRDERYLPFEGAGAISEWSLELFNDLPSNNPDFGKPLRQFDYNTISDAILHVKYTAREDAGPFKNGAIAHLREYYSEDETTPSLRLLNIRQEFPTQWHRFFNPIDQSKGNIIELVMSQNLFPYRDLGKTLKVNTIWLLARCMQPGSYEVILTPESAEAITMQLAKVSQYGGLHFSQKDVSGLEVNLSPADPPEVWELKMTGPNGKLKAAEVENLFLVLGYEWL